MCINNMFLENDYIEWLHDSGKWVRTKSKFGGNGSGLDPNFTENGSGIDPDFREMGQD